MSNQLRVVFISHNYYPLLGGAERQIMSIGPLLQERGIDLHIVTRRYPGLAAYEEIAGVPTHRILAPKPVASPVFTLLAIPKIWRLQADVVHAFSLFSPLTTAVVAKLLLRTPVAVKLLRGGTLGDMIRLRNKWLGKTRLGLFRRTVDRFISISDEITKELAVAGINGQQQVSIPNGVDTERFAPVDAETRRQLRTSLGLDLSGPIVIYTGRLVPEKRVDLLLSVWPSIRQEHPTAQLVIVGEGEQADQLQTKTSAGVIWTGYVDDVAPYLQAADVFVLPSVSEGLSNALLEAMASGLASVVTPVGGAVDFIVDRENGWFISPDSAQELGEALSQLLDNPHQRAELAAAGRATVEDTYSLTSIADQLVALYWALSAQGDT